MKSTTTVRRVVLTIIGVFMTLAVAAGGIGIQLAASKTALAAPTITSTPANPTSSQSAAFAFTGPKGATFQCQLDSTPTFTICTSPKSYLAPLLAEGSHIFQVKALSGSDVSAVASYTWIVDTTPPTVTINQSSGQADPTNNGSVVFTATFSEPVTGFTSTDVTAGGTAGGARSIAITGTGPVYTVTISGATGNGTITAYIAAHTVQDLAGNANTTASTSTDNTVTLDTVPPPAPVLTTKPDNPTFNATNTFAWPLSETGLSFQCSLENGAWFDCPTPYTYFIVTSNYGQHQFAVRAVDAAGNISAATSYTFKYEKKLPTSGVPFTITGSVSGLSIGVWKPIAVTISNPNNVTIFVSVLTVTLGTSSHPTTCPSSANVELWQSDVSTANTVAVLAYGTVVLPAQKASAPQIRLMNLSTNQDACKDTTFGLTYTGTATN